MNDKHWWEVFESAQNGVNRILLYGPPGTGKTTTALQINPRAYPVTIHPEMSAQELIGHFVPKGGDFEWHDGPALRALRQGVPLILNEVDKSSGSVMTQLHSLCDDHDVIEFTLPTGEVVKPSPGYKVFATMNGFLDALPDAIQDRFSVRIKADMPHQDALLKIQEDDIREAVSNYYKARAEGSTGKAGRVSLREALAFEELTNGTVNLPKEAAAESVWGDRGEEVLFALNLGSKA